VAAPTGWTLMRCATPVRRARTYVLGGAQQGRTAHCFTVHLPGRRGAARAKGGAVRVIELLEQLARPAVVPTYHTGEGRPDAFLF